MSLKKQRQKYEPTAEWVYVCLYWDQIENKQNALRISKVVKFHKPAAIAIQATTTIKATLTHAAGETNKNSYYVYAPLDIRMYADHVSAHS